MAERLSGKALDRYRDALTVATRRWTAEAQPIIDRMARYYRGDQWPSAAPGAPPGRVPPVVANLIFSDVKIILPALALRNARVYVKPTKASRMAAVPQPDGSSLSTVVLDVLRADGALVPIPILEAAQAKEVLANWRWRELRLVHQVRRVLQDSLMAPFGVLRLGYTLETEKIERGTGEELETHELIKAESPFAVRWSPRDFRVDPEARYPDLSDAGWIAFGWTARLEDVRRNPRFRGTKGLQGTVALRDTYTDDQDPGASRRLDAALRAPDDEDAKRVRLWELWDKRTHKRLVLADHHATALEYVDWPQAYEGFPCETLVLSETPDTLYGRPDLFHTLWAQDAYNELSAMALVQTKRQLRKFLVKVNAFDEAAKQQLTSDLDGEVVETPLDLKEAFMAADTGSVSPDVYTTRISFRDDHDRIGGIGDFMRGVAEKVDTATEAELIQANQSVRVNDARALVEDFAARLTRKLLQVEAQTLSTPAMIPIVGVDGAVALNQFHTIADRTLLQAEADVEVEIGSMQPINEAQRKRDMGEVYAVWRDDPTIDQVGLKRSLAQVYQTTLPHLARLVKSEAEIRAIAQAMGPEAGGPGDPAMGGTPLAEAAGPELG